MWALIVRPQAELDIEEIAASIALDSPDSATRFLVALQRTLDDIATYPNLGYPEQRRTKTRRSLRHRAVYGFRNHLVYYVVQNTKTVRVIRILHGASNVNLRLRDIDTD